MIASYSDSIINAVFRSTRFSSKICNYCELSKKFYPKENDLIIGILNCSKQLSFHYCFGNIQYHPSKTQYFEEANMFFEYEQNIIQKQSWVGENIKIQESNVFFIKMQENLKKNVVFEKC